MNYYMKYSQRLPIINSVDKWSSLLEIFYRVFCSERLNCILTNRMRVCVSVCMRVCVRVRVVTFTRTSGMTQCKFSKEVADALSFFKYEFTSVSCWVLVIFSSV